MVVKQERTDRDLLDQDTPLSLSPDPPDRPHFVRAALLVLFAASGCAGLIYEVVWFQQLQLVIGSTAISLGLLLATYMAGLCLGSLAAPRFVSFQLNPLRAYGVIEFGIGLLGLLILLGMPYLGSLYVLSATHAFPNILLRGVVAAAYLLPPTVLMGGTFPVLSRCVDATKTGVSWLGLLYTANLAGAVFGCLWTGFYLLRVYDLAVATYAAVAINVLVGSATFLASTIQRRLPSTERMSKAPAIQIENAATIYLAIGLSGFSALGAQVVWTRLLSYLFSTTVYTFSIILAIFLVGIGLGGGFGSVVARWTDRPRLFFGISQLLLAGAIAWTVWAIAKSLPYWPVDPALAASAWFNFELDFCRALWAVLPPAVFWGASFPLALASVAVPALDPAEPTARIYAANTLGAIAGALVFSFVLIPRAGTMFSQQLLTAIPSVAAIVVFAALYFQPAPGGKKGLERQRWLISGVSAALALGLVATVSDVPWQLIAYGRRVALMSYSDRRDSKTNPVRVLYRGEGLNSSVVITDQSGLRIIYVNGNAEASNAIDDMRLQRLAGHVPALIQGTPRDVLVVGFGAGVTAGSFVNYPGVKRIVIAEIESLIPPASAKYFKQDNYGVFGDPRTTMFYDDGRHYLLTHNDRFDVITADPVHLWVKGTSALYSKEYFQAGRNHLKPGGVFAQWLPLYDGDEETVKSAMATFFEVFPNGTVWSNHTGDRGYDLVLLGAATPLKINIDDIEDRLDRPNYSAVLESLQTVGFNSAFDVVETYLGSASDLAPWLAGAQINLDRNLRLQYLAGLAINSNASAEIYQALLSYRRFPDTIVGSDRYIEPLRLLFGPTGR